MQVLTLFLIFCIVIGFVTYYLRCNFKEKDNDTLLSYRSISDVETSFGGLGEEIIMTWHDKIKKMVAYEAEQGFALPNDFKTDPAAWLEVLRSIEYAFDELYKEYSGDFTVETDQEKMVKRENKIQKGLELFGKYLRDLN